MGVQAISDGDILLLDMYGVFGTYLIYITPMSILYQNVAGAVEYTDCFSAEG